MFVCLCCESNISNISNINNNPENKDILNDELEEELEPFDILATNNDKQDISLDLEIEELCEDFNEQPTTDLKEINVNTNFEHNLETISLKKPNQVYFELYKEARNKAKEAKKNAILAYLEAKNIKKTYLIENINDSDSEFDAEIDEVSESELEGL